MPHNSPLHVLESADSATICLENQKNGRKGGSVHHKATTGAFCPIKALARRVFNIFWGSNSDEARLGHVYRADGTISRVADKDINVAIRWGALADGLLARGYTLDRISSHSLRAAGAMALKLNGCSTETIMRLGRWTSLTYLTYIHTQIGALSEGMSELMATEIVFQNVG